jgi:hypothetical protein
MVMAFIASQDLALTPKGVTAKTEFKAGVKRAL